MSDVQVAVGAAVEDRVAVASNWKLVWWRFRRHHLALVSAGILICMYLVVLCPAFFSTQNPERTDARQAFIPVQTLHFFDDGWNPWVPGIAGKPQSADAADGNGPPTRNARCASSSSPPANRIRVLRVCSGPTFM